MIIKILVWLGRFVGWGLIGFVVLVVPFLTISTFAGKSENPENMLLPYVIMMIAMPFSFLLGIAGGMVSWRPLKKETHGIVGSILGGLLSPILAFVIFLFDIDFAAKFYIHPLEPFMIYIMTKVFEVFIKVTRLFSG